MGISRNKQLHLYSGEDLGGRRGFRWRSTWRVPAIASDRDLAQLMGSVRIIREPIQNPNRAGCCTSDLLHPPTHPLENLLTEHGTAGRSNNECLSQPGGSQFGQRYKGVTHVQFQPCLSLRSFRSPHYSRRVPELITTRYSILIQPRPRSGLFLQIPSPNLSTSIT